VTVSSENAKRNGLLTFHDHVEIQKKYSGEPAQDVPYKATLADGSTTEGRTNAEGIATLEEIPPGPLKVDWNPE